MIPIGPRVVGVRNAKTDVRVNPPFAGQDSVSSMDISRRDEEQVYASDCSPHEFPSCTVASKFEFICCRLRENSRAKLLGKRPKSTGLLTTSVAVGGQSIHLTDRIVTRRPCFLGVQERLPPATNLVEMF